MEIQREGKHPNGTGEVFYSDVTPTDAEQLLRRAREFVDVPTAELTGETTVVTTTIFSAKNGVVKRASIVYDLTHGTVESKTQITTESEALYHSNH